MNEQAVLTRQDFVSSSDVRWCPGCGDYSILAGLQSILPELGIPRENIVIVSGIGCSSRLPYYVDTYGIHSIHGRAPAIATGIAVARPDLTVFVATGDGDALSIGGNHLIHALRRNVNLTILLFNNEIYGLTKGQYSPTSPEGSVTKSSPFGSIDHPFNPLSLALGADATFVAKAIDTDRETLVSTMLEGARHVGSSFIEIDQNCPIFNDGAYEHIKGPSANVLRLKDGEPLTWGDYGLVRNSEGRLEARRLADTHPDSILVHNAHDQDPSFAFALTHLADSLGALAPTPVGVLRDVRRETYDGAVHAQLEANRLTGDPTASLQTLLAGPDPWIVS